ncbi:MAG TPA: diguanylate cyclase, partial [Gammaproteobacteria bacterium]|nr:diguanylate cyclase [Gammaproteobacteria bacterium]
MKILVASPLEITLTKVLRKCNHDVTLVHDIHEIIATFHSFKPDVVMLDRSTDAFQYLKQIYLEEDFHKTIFIYLSDNLNDPQLLKVIDAGFDDFFIQTENEIEIQIYIKRMQHLSDLKKQLYFYSTRDPLTEVGNPAELENRLLKAIEESDQTNLPFAILFIDLDNFKMVNDNIGHLMGDALLKEIAKRLKSCLRTYDFIARVGGDEFVIILKDIENTYDVDRIAQKIIETMSKSYTLNKMEVMVKLSMGIALYPEDGADAISILQNADIAMYHAKKLGQNNYQFHSTAQQLQYKNKIELENDLNFALDKNELFLQYQPIYDLKEKEIVGMEALLRWHHKIKGLILPEVFIPIAEENGIIFQITEWVLEEICRQVSEWDFDQMKDFKISFNVSASLLLKKNLSKSILTVIEKS